MTEYRCLSCYLPMRQEPHRAVLVCPLCAREVTRMALFARSDMQRLREVITGISDEQFIAAIRDCAARLRAKPARPIRTGRLR